MGLFGSSKKEDKKELPPLQFPELPKTVPAYEPGKTSAPQEKPVAPVPSSQTENIPIMPSAAPELPSGIGGMEQPLFVKIDKYREVIDNLNKLKSRLNEAGNILNKLNRLKEEEDRELAAWHNDLARIKSQLMDVDKKLFE